MRRTSSILAMRYGVARFTDMSLSVKHKDVVVYTAPLIPYKAPVPDPTHRYHLIMDRTVPSVEESLTSTPAVAPGAKP